MLQEESKKGKPFTKERNKEMGKGERTRVEMLTLGIGVWRAREREMLKLFGHVLNLSKF